MATLTTPCIAVCVLDSRTGLCEGCGRTLDEIARWGGMAEAERREIMQRLGDRARTAGDTDRARPEPRP